MGGAVPGVRIQPAADPAPADTGFAVRLARSAPVRRHEELAADLAAAVEDALDEGAGDAACIEVVRADLEKLRAAVGAMGGTLEEPFLQLAFLPLPVIPHLKITDLGMIDVDTMSLLS